MANKTNRILIESILGGTAPTTHFAAADQFRASFAIDPSMPVDNGDGVYSSIASGLLRPVGSNNVGINTTNAVMWFVQNPKDTVTSSSFAYDAGGSVYLIAGYGAPSFLKDLNDGPTASGNGAAYYDNYAYFAKDTTIARYGPLNGEPAFTEDYWTGTLGKVALSNPTYPGDPWVGEYYSNHVLHRHSDGKLYIADVVDNQATVHYIKTTKTTVEGDTDNGSTYDALNFGYGLKIFAMESYGDMLVFCLNETSDNDAGPIYSHRARVAFWDTTSTKTNQITSVEFPDELITAVKNINGVLYFCSGSMDDFGFRVTRYIGGYSFEEVAYSEMGYSPHAGAILGRGNNLFFGSANTVPDYDRGHYACVWSLNLKKSGLSSGLFNVARPGFGAVSAAYGVTALEFEPASNFNQTALHAATDADGGQVDRIFQSTLEGSPVWWSQTFRIGQAFKITKLIIPTLKSSSSSKKQIVPTLYFDNGTTTKTLQTMDYDANNLVYVIRPENAVGKHEFFLELKWSGRDVLVTEDGGPWTVGLPITIEYELISNTNG